MEVSAKSSDDSFVMMYLPAVLYLEPYNGSALQSSAASSKGIPHSKDKSTGMCAAAACGNDTCKQLQQSTVSASKLQMNELAILHTSFSKRMICHLKRSPAFGQHKCKTTCVKKSPIAFSQIREKKMMVNYVSAFLTPQFL